MNPVIETGALIGAAILVGITLLLVPVPKQKPPEFDRPPVEVPPPPPTPQEVVSAPVITAVIPALTPEQEEKDHLATIESKLLHIQQQVQQMEQKVE